MINRKFGAFFALLVLSLFLVPNLASAKYKMVNPEVYSNIIQDIAFSGSDTYMLTRSSVAGYIMERHGSGPWVIGTSTPVTGSAAFSKIMMDGTKAYVAVMTGGNKYIFSKADANSPWVATPTGVNNRFAGIFFKNGIGYAETYDGQIWRSIDDGQSWAFSTSTGMLPTSFGYSERTFNRLGDENNQIVYGATNFYSTADSGASWQAIPRPALSGQALYTDFLFDDVNSGLAVTSDGKIKYTTDAGANWHDSFASSTWQFKTVYENGGKYYALGLWYDVGSAKVGVLSANSTAGPWSLVNGETIGVNMLLRGSSNFDANGKGYFFANTGVIGLTNDAGATWTYPSQKQRFDINNLSFLDNNNGYSVGGFNNGNSYFAGEAFKTSDGGATWNQIFTSTSTDFISVYATGTDVWLGKPDNGVLEHSSNGGQTWTTTADSQSGDINDIHFFSTSTGLVAGSWITSKTTDGGNTWNGVEGSTGFEFSFPADNVGYMVSLGGYIYKTTDEGDDWTIQTSNTNSDLHSIAFVSTSTGWAVGAGGAIVHTTDGGTNWIATTSAICPACTFSKVRFSSPLNGRIIGMDSNYWSWILETFDGGTTWQGEKIAANTIANFFGNSNNVGLLSLAAKPNGDFFLGGTNGTLFDYDATVGISSPTINTSEGHTITFDVSRNNTVGNLAVNYNVSGLNDSNTSNPLSSYISITDGNTTGSAYISTVDNHIVEGNKSFSVAISPGEYSVDPAASFSSSTLFDINVAAVDAPSDLSVTEGGATDTLSVYLDSIPASDITLSLTDASSSDIALSATTLSFNASNWNIPQNVTVSAVDDQVVNGTRQVYLRTNVSSSSDPNYPTDSFATTIVTVLDNDVAPVSSGGGGGGGGYVPQPLSGNYQLSINQGATQASSTQVTLSLTAGSDITKMAISNTADFANSSQESFTPTKSWTLLPGDGPKTVYAKLYNSYGVSSDVISASITLNTNPSTSTPGTSTPPVVATSGNTTVPAQPIYVKSSDLLKLKFGDYTFKDTDKDGLADQLETLLGTDPKKMDTDKDGYSDGTEIANGYDPLTTGKITPEEQAIIKAHPQWIDTDLNGIPDSLQKALGFSLRATKNKKDGASLQKGYNPFTKTYLQPSASLIKRLKNQTLIEVKTGIALKVDAKGIVSLK